MIPITIQYLVKFITPFHIGTGKGAGLIDKIVRKDRNGILYIPGSVIKGYVRESALRLKNTGFFKKNGQTFPQFESAYKELFGDESIEGSVFFDNLRMIDEQKNLFYGIEIDRRYLQTEERMGNKINRILGKAEEKKLFQSEYGVYRKDSPFCFEGEIWGTISKTSRDQLADIESSLFYVTPEVFLLFASLLMVKRIGAGKSAGYGQCEIEVKTIKVDDEDISDKWQLSNCLMQNINDLRTVLELL